MSSSVSDSPTSVAAALTWAGVGTCTAMRGLLSIRQHYGRGQRHVWPTIRVSRHSLSGTAGPVGRSHLVHGDSPIARLPRVLPTALAPMHPIVLCGPAIPANSLASSSFDVN